MRFGSGGLHERTGTAFIYGWENFRLRDENDGQETVFAEAEKFHYRWALIEKALQQVQPRDVTSSPSASSVRHRRH